jgi:hypothetical protein
MNTTTPTVNWTRTGLMGITTNGWTIMARQSYADTYKAWSVFDDADNFVGFFATRDEAVAVAR